MNLFTEDLFMRSKKRDLKLVNEFVEVLERFLKEKTETWEKIDDAMQADIIPGTPSEDWINPPDENITEKILMQDEEYRDLKEKIRRLRPEIQEIAQFLGDGKSNALEWIHFTNPLIGNAALEDGINYGKMLSPRIQETNYLVKNFANIFK
jgi:hypothetical protein